MLKKVPTFLLLLCLCQPLLFSQEYFFRSYSVEQGMPQSSVYCLLQDSRGFIWMGTDGGGLSRFDGHSFATYTKADGLSDNVVRSLMEDRKGNIWIGTDNGITLYDGYGFKKIGKSDGLNGTSVLKIIQSENGTVWAATNDGGLAGIKGTDSLKIRNFTTKDGLLSDFIFDIYEDQGNRLWLGMVGGVNIIDIADEADSIFMRKLYTPAINSDVVPTILSIESGRDGTLLFGTYGNGLFKSSMDKDPNDIQINPSQINSKIPGLVIWDLSLMKNGELWLATDQNGVIRSINDNVFAVFDKESGLQSNQILDIMEDRDKNIWFASFGQGAMMFTGEKFVGYSEREGIRGTQVLDILFNPDNTFYVATEEGLNRFKKIGNRIERTHFYSSVNGLNSKGVNVIEKNGDRLLIGTKNGINILKGSRITEFDGNANLENKDISSIVAGNTDNIWVGTKGGYGRVFDGKLFFMSQEEGLINDEIQTVLEDKKGRIWLGTLGGLVRLEGKTYTDFNEEDGLTELKINSLALDNSGNILIGTFGGGIFKFDAAKDSMPVSVYASKGILSSNTINSLKFINDTLLIAGNDKGFDLLLLDKDQNVKSVIHNSLSDGFTGGENNPNAIAIDKEGLIWFGTKKGLVRYNPANDLNSKAGPQVFITGIKLFYNDIDWTTKGFSTGRFSKLPENLILTHGNNHLTFIYTGLSYDNPELEFSYFLENQSKEWSPFSSNRDMPFPGLTPGSYTFKVKAKNKYGITGPPAEYSFVIKPPFWKTPWFIISSGILFLVAIIIVVRIRERNLIREKENLEKIVEERTREVVEQKDEIAKQRDVVVHQKKEITDSIQYAERIQRAVLPVDTILKTRFSDYFVLFRPKDIVSGDFYWMAEKDDHIVFTAADCTGHGVPGAFMSMLGVSFLNKIVIEEGIVTPSKILNLLRNEIIVSLKQEGTFETNKDGMDIALCSIDFKNLTLQFAGANNPLLIVRKENNEYTAIQVKGDKMPVGFYSRMDDFTNKVLELRKGDSLYLFSDGFEDQFGGPDGKKFMKSRFSKMLTENQSLPMEEQKMIYSKTLDEWLNQASANWTPSGQIDDVILIGVKI